MMRSSPLQAVLHLTLLLLVLFPSCSRPFLGRNENCLKIRVVFKGNPVPGAEVGLYPTPYDFPEKPFVSGIAGEDGELVLKVAEGRKYYLVAQKKLSPGKMAFGYFGGNPIYPGGSSSLSILLPLVEYSGKVVRQKYEASILRGNVIFDGSPLPNCYVFAFPDDESDFRDPNDAVMSLTDEKGYFEMEVPPGEYFIVAKKRKTGSFAGPLGEGDYTGYFPENPVSIGPGEAIEIELPVVLLKMRNPQVFQREGIAVIEGIIIDETGKPVEGVHAALYDNPDLLNRPVVISSPTGRDGKFVLYVPYSGKFYLGARTGYGGAPGPGDLYGKYEGTPDHSIVVDEGDRIGGVTIIVTEVW